MWPLNLNRRGIPTSLYREWVLDGGCGARLATTDHPHRSDSGDHNMVRHPSQSRWWFRLFCGHRQNRRLGRLSSRCVVRFQTGRWCVLRTALLATHQERDRGDRRHQRGSDSQPSNATRREKARVVIAIKRGRNRRGIGTTRPAIIVVVGASTATLSVSIIPDKAALCRVATRAQVLTGPVVTLSPFASASSRCGRRARRGRGRIGRIYSADPRVEIWTRGTALRVEDRFGVAAGGAVAATAAPREPGSARALLEGCDAHRRVGRRSRRGRRRGVRHACRCDDRDCGSSRRGSWVMC